MEILTFLYQLLIMPLQILFEEIYFFAYYISKNLGVAIIVFSFMISMLVTPLYNRADAIQKEERDIEAKLAKGVEHIKKTFRGDEQLMMLQTYYRKNNYSPLYFLRGSLSLFLQIPFFIAAYQFLSNLELLKGVSFWFIKDLAAPDALLNVGGMVINVLPIIMTIVNLVSTFFFTQGFPLKTKLQLNGMALFFLVFLYNSPAGLVLYWTCNNIFNLVKTFINKLSQPEKGVYVVLSICSLIVIVYGCIITDELSLIRIVRILPYVFVLNLPFIIAKVKQYKEVSVPNVVQTPMPKLLIVSTIFLTLLIGGVVPSAVISSSPQEFIIGDYFINPVGYITYTLIVAFGTFVIWLGIFYWITNKGNRFLFEKITWFCCVIATINYMFFGNKLGLLTTTLEYENGLVFSKLENYVNIIIVLMLILLSNRIWNLYKRYLFDVLIIGTIALMGMVIINITTIKTSIDKIRDSYTQGSDINQILNLSKNGKNIVVFMLDRAIGLYVPYIFNEKPTLKEKFSGFTYYANTVSYGGYTNFTTPSLFGGYEYTPIEMNKRDQETLMDKHNEAIKVMPVLFNENNFDVTVCDPSYANYQMIPDISLYDDYPDIKKYRTLGKFGSRVEKVDKLIEDSMAVEKLKRNFFLFSIMKCSPISIQKRIYNYGQYNKLLKDSQNQEITTLYTAKNTSKRFLERYNVLKNLSVMTNITNTGNNFIMLVNHTTHEPCLLQTPEYVPSPVVDNREYERKYRQRFNLNGIKLNMGEDRQVIHYHANMAALIQLGNWFDYMRDNNVYDNTRIIVVADHGRALKQVDEFVLDDSTDYMADIQHYYPLFMVKDFNEKSFKINDEFMTNADVATIATKDVIANPINPFTGKLINNTAKFNSKQYILSSRDWDVTINNGNTYLSGKWYSVHTDMRDRNNWELVKENDVLPY